MVPASWADAVASAPSVASTRIASKVAVFLCRPASPEKPGAPRQLLSCLRPPRPPRPYPRPAPCLRRPIAMLAGCDKRVCTEPVMRMHGLVPDQLAEWVRPGYAAPTTEHMRG